MVPRSRTHDFTSDRNEFEHYYGRRARLRRANDPLDVDQRDNINGALDQFERIQIVEHRAQLVEYEQRLLDHHSEVLQEIDGFLDFSRRQHCLFNLMLVMMMIFTILNVGFLVVVSFRVLKQCKYDYVVSSRSCPDEIFHTFDFLQ